MGGSYYGWRGLPALGMMIVSFHLHLHLMGDESRPVVKVSGAAAEYVAPPWAAGVERVTDRFETLKFSEAYSNLWGAQHQNVSPDDSSVTLMLDVSSGSGFKSNEPYTYGLFNAGIKLQGGYTAGIITSFYLSNNQVYEGWHDEIDVEFLGTIPGEPFKLQTNVYGNGTGDGSHLIGREQQFHLWFDPTLDFHNYTILWTPHQILFMVDSIPIRRFPKVRSLGATYPSKAMSVYATTWDASSWATDGGKYKANYTYQPFLSTYTNFIVDGCDTNSTTQAYYNCSHGFLDSFIPPKLNKRQRHALRFVRNNYMIYDYCRDFQRYPNRMPECPPLPPPPPPPPPPPHP